MHELSLALELVEHAVEIAKKENVKNVLEIQVRVGPDSGVDIESFKFAFPEAAKHSVLANCKLVVEAGTGREFQFVNMEVEDV